MYIIISIDGKKMYIAVVRYHIIIQKRKVFVWVNNHMWKYDRNTPWNMHESEQVKVKSLSCVQLLTTPWTVTCQAPPSMEFSRQEYWSWLPPQGIFPPQGLNMGLLHCRQTLYCLSYQGTPEICIVVYENKNKSEQFYKHFSYCWNQCYKDQCYQFSLIDLQIQ